MIVQRFKRIEENFGYIRYVTIVNDRPLNIEVRKNLTEHIELLKQILIDEMMKNIEVVID